MEKGVHESIHVLQSQWYVYLELMSKRIVSSFKTVDKTANPKNIRQTGYRMRMLALTVTLLASGTARFPQLLPGPGQSLTRIPELVNLDIPARHLPLAGWHASQALGAMQEPIPDFNFKCKLLKSQKSN